MNDELNDEIATIIAYFERVKGETSDADEWTEYNYAIQVLERLRMRLDGATLILSGIRLLASLDK